MSAARKKGLELLFNTFWRPLDVYTVTLPPNLPPTYRGRSLRFSYHLSVGACRATAGSPNSQSRVMKVPIRIYNHVSGACFPSFTLMDMV